MVNLFEIARHAPSGSGLDALSRQFGLDPSQMQMAVEALLPAFTLAFQRSVSQPAAFGDLIGAIGSGRYAPFYDASANASPSMASGEHILAQLFKSPEAVRQVASQAAAMSGLGVQVLQQMLPRLAAILIGGMFRYASVEGFADLLRQWSDALKAVGSNGNAPQAPGHPLAAWSDAARAMMGQAQPAAPSPPRAPANPVEAWTAMMAAMMGGAKASPPPPLPPKEPTPFDALSKMFETGIEVQSQHLADLRKILDGVWGSAAEPAPDRR